jgi:hypothetical protein
VIVCGDVGVLSVTVMVAESGPPVVGAKRTPIRHCAPGARVPPTVPPAGPLQVFEVSKDEAFVPPSVMLWK